MTKKDEVAAHHKLNRIKRTMKTYQNAFDRSLKARQMSDTFVDDKHEFHIYYSKMVDAEIRCMELDEMINKMVDEYQYLINK